MVFKRRTPRPFLRRVAEFFYPRGGWGRAFSYMWHRMRRLPDEPHRIARGMFAGILASFTPLFGFHFVIAATIGYLIRANILASLLATFIGNPLTFPFIAGSALATGNWIFGLEGNFSFPQIMAAFSRAGAELWHNLGALITGEPVHWTSLKRFFDRVFLPYLVGGIIPGTIAGIVGYYVTVPLVAAYQRRRKKKLRERFERIRAAMAERAAEAARMQAGAEPPGADGQGAAAADDGPRPSAAAGEGPAPPAGAEGGLSRAPGE